MRWAWVDTGLVSEQEMKEMHKHESEAEESISGDAKWCSAFAKNYIFLEATSIVVPPTSEADRESYLSIPSGRLPKERVWMIASRDAASVTGLTIDEWERLPSYMNLSLESMLSDFSNRFQKAKAVLHDATEAGKPRPLARAVAAIDALKSEAMTRLFNPSIAKAFHAMCLYLG